MAEKTIDMCVITAQTLQNAKLAYFMVEALFRQSYGSPRRITVEKKSELAAKKLAQFHGYMESFVTDRARNQFISEIRDYLIREARDALRTRPTIPVQG